MADLQRIDPNMWGESTSRDRVIATLADRQHGVVARWQLLRLSFSAKEIDHRVATCRLHAIHRGTYAVGHRRLTLRGRWMAAVLACGPASLLSHKDAAALWDLLPVRGTRTEVLVPGRRVVRPGIVAHQARSLHPDDRGIRDGIPVTSIPRLLLDVAETESADLLERIFEEAERRRCLDWRKLHELLERSTGRKGLKPLTALLKVHDGHIPDIRSELERLFFSVCRKHDLPLPACNAVVDDRTVDAFWPRAKLVVEVDSWRHHRDRKDFENDRLRDIELQVAGYRVARVTHRRLTDEPGVVAAQLRHLLAVTGA